MSRNIDILILGANGFTGRLTARYLQAHPQRSQFSLALAGRSLEKLQFVVDSVQPSNPTYKIDIHQIDIKDDKALETLFSTAKCVVNCIGPYWITGTPIFAACANTGTHYCDLSGELPWVMNMIKEYDAVASKNAAIMIPCAGLDCVPSDLSVYLSVRHAKEKLGEDVTLGESRTGLIVATHVSGGTAISLLDLFENVPQKTLLESAEPYALSPVKGLKPPATKLYYKMPHSNWNGAYWMPSVIDSAIVQRTWGLSKLAQESRASESEERKDVIHYAGPNLCYDEFFATNGSTRIPAIIFSLFILGCAYACSSSKYLRNLFKKHSPKSGEGPSEEAMKAGRIEVQNVTATDEKEERLRTHIKSHLKFNADTYMTTSVLVSEIALSIVLDYNKLPKAAQKGGVLTPAFAMGDILVERLTKSGHATYECEIIPPKKQKHV